MHALHTNKGNFQKNYLSFHSILIHYTCCVALLTTI